MKLITFSTGNQVTHAGVVHGDRVFTLQYSSLLALLRDPNGLELARMALLAAEQEEEIRETYEYGLSEVTLLTPIPEPPTLRDFYAFEQHVKTARAQRGLAMMSEWYEIPTFYFTNTSELYGTDVPVPYPVGSQTLDFELEIACVIGREGKNIPVAEAADYIAGYMVMNDWSARDFQQKDMLLNLGPGKGKDFATSLGPWLVTSDELVARRTGSGATERYNMAMLARINGKEVSRGNFKDIYYSFPEMVAWASRNVRLRPGDVLGSGTVGTGCLLELLHYPQSGSSQTKNVPLIPAPIGRAGSPTEEPVVRWLQPHDEIELEIEGIGILRNRII